MLTRLFILSVLILMDHPYFIHFFLCALVSGRFIRIKWLLINYRNFNNEIYFILPYYNRIGSKKPVP